MMEIFCQRMMRPPFSRKIDQAREYWLGNVKNELPEILIDGKIEVVEVIEDFTD